MIHNITVSQYHNITISQYHSITISQYYDITISQYYDITISQYHNITISQHHNITSCDCDCDSQLFLAGNPPQMFSSPMRGILILQHFVPYLEGQEPNQVLKTKTKMTEEDDQEEGTTTPENSLFLFPKTTTNFALSCDQFQPMIDFLPNSSTRLFYF